MPEAAARPTRALFSHFTAQPTRWGDLDALGHVNNTRFFTFDESARLDYWTSLMQGDPAFFRDYGLILASIRCDFLAQLHHPTALEVGLRVARLGRSSFTTEAAMFGGERLYAVTQATLVWFDYREQKALPIPEAVRARVLARERVAPEQG
ncbi:MAG TPA: thioesterase family protein [Nevskiaceae bacterium]|nr:thioesterase family protein [Nevskiaceae bacterium]